MNAAAPSHPRSITESPWYWAYVFCTGGLIALVVMGPRYTQRQTQIEQNLQKRQWAAQHVAGQAQSDLLPGSEEMSITLWPLFVVLGSILAVAWIKLIRDHLKRRNQQAEPTVESENDNGVTVDALTAEGGTPMTMFESPILVIVIGLTTTALLGGLWLQTGKRPLLVLLVAVLALTVAGVVLERSVETDREQIEKTLHRIARDIERNDRPAVLAHIHSRAALIRQAAATETAAYEFEQVNIKSNLKIDVDASAEPKTATAKFNVVVIGSGGGLGKRSRVPRYVTLELGTRRRCLAGSELQTRGRQHGVQKAVVTRKRTQTSDDQRSNDMLPTLEKAKLWRACMPVNPNHGKNRF